MRETSEGTRRFHALFADSREVEKKKKEKREERRRGEEHRVFAKSENRPNTWDCRARESDDFRSQARSVSTDIDTD
jgi:hypothetical protein